MILFGELVGARGFEPRTSCAQGRRATRLRYAPTSKYLRLYGNPRFERGSNDAGYPQLFWCIQ